MHLRYEYGDMAVSIEAPPSLFRYRPLNKEFFDRELEALRDSYIYAAQFDKMNDPMEAFYEIGGPSAQFLDTRLASIEKKVRGVFQPELAKMFKYSALISFSTTNEALPMWAYYASNFAGMCLEFDSAELEIGDLQGEVLRPVSYARKPLPSLTSEDMVSEKIKETVFATMCHKRSEWAHEKEWRFLVGEEGQKHYLDDALKRVFLGPRINPAYRDRILEILRNRSVEVFQGVVKGFELEFQCIKPSAPINQIERVGFGQFNSDNDLCNKDALIDFLDVPIERLLHECSSIALRPNVETIDSIDVSTHKEGHLYIQVYFKLRDGRKMFRKLYFDNQMRRARIST